MDNFNYFSVKDLLSKPVIDAAGNDFGEIKDIILDSYDKRVKYLVISKNRILGFDIVNNYKAVPVKAVEINPNTRAVMFCLGNDFINNSPDIDFDNFENKDKEIFNQLSAYYGESPEKEAPPRFRTDAGNDPYYSGDRHFENEGDN